MQTQILSFDPRKRKQISCGMVSGRDFIKKVKSNKHLLRIYNGYALQEDAFNEIKKQCDRIIINEDDHKRYEISIEDFLKNAISFNAGHGKQLVIQISKMRKIDSKQGELFP